MKSLTFVPLILLLGCGDPSVADPSYGSVRAGECSRYGLSSEQDMDEMIEQCRKNKDCTYYGVHLVTQYCRLDDSKPMSGQMEALNVLYKDVWEDTRPPNIPRVCWTAYNSPHDCR